MSADVTFRWKRGEPPAGTVDARSLLPEKYPGAGVSELAGLPLTIGNRSYRWDDLFDIEGDTAHIWRLPGCENYLYLGARMSCGTLIVEGHAGDYAGLQMRGGLLQAEGAGHRVGANLQGGLIHIHGHVGMEAGGPAPDSMDGMVDGEILVDGNAGPRAGFRLRRGLLSVHQAEEEAGYDLQAGTLVIQQGPLRFPGLNMRRGTILLLDSQTNPDWLPYFQAEACFEPVIVRMILGRLVQLHYAVPRDAIHGTYQLYSGDHLVTGQGEILQLQGRE